MLKYLVICVSESQDVCSVDSFDTEQEANDFLKADATKTYEETSYSGAPSIEVSPGDATVVSDGCIYRWSVYPLTIR